MSIATTMAIRDQMTQTLNRMERYTRQLNAALRETGVITETANPGEAYDRASASILRAADQVDRFNDQQTQAERQAQAVGGAWSKVGGYVKSAAAAFGVSKLVGLSDTIAGNRARLGLIVDDGGSVAELENKIFASAMRARAAYTDVAESVSKLGLLAGKAFGSNDEIIAFTELMNKNFALSGADQATRSAAMRQLTQAMGSGRLQGDEYVSITENASLLANAIEDYMRNVQGAKGSMKDWASEGLLTADVIKAAMFNTADEVEKRFEETPMTWAQVGTLAANIAIKALDPLLTAINWLANNIRIIGPLVLGLGGAFAVFQVAAHWTAIAGAVTGAYHFAVNLLSIGFGVLSGSSAAASAAVFTFNSALLASPITWVVMGVLLLVGVLFAAVAAFNKLTGASVSATGIIFGAVATLAAAVMNTVIGLLNALLQLAWNNFVTPFLGVIEFVLNVVNGGFDSFGGAVANLIGQIISWFLSLGQVVTKIIDAIFGTDWTSGLEALKGNVLAWGKNENAITLDRSAPEIPVRFDYKDAWKSGYSLGEGLASKAAGLFGGADSVDWDALQQGVDATAANTGAMADEVNIADEDLKFMKDVAEMRYVQNFVTLTPTVSMDARISERVDVNEVVSSIAQVLEEEIAISAEGAYA